MTKNFETREFKYSPFNFDGEVTTPKNPADKSVNCSAYCLANLFRSPEPLALLKEEPFDKLFITPFVEGLIMRNMEFPKYAREYSTHVIEASYTSADGLSPDYVYNLLKNNPSYEIGENKMLPILLGVTKHPTLPGAIGITHRIYILIGGDKFVLGDIELGEELIFFNAESITFFMQNTYETMRDISMLCNIFTGETLRIQNRYQ